ncbi:class I SAM-dependent methyltransferase [Novosphingobium flavum]|nr:class I SAM-dependent methyltransferase [Novosphingobium flavum]
MPACAATSGSCHYGPAPQLVLETGNTHAPVVEIWRCTACGHGVTRPEMADVSPLYAGRESEDFLARDAGWVEALKNFVVRRLARGLLAFANPAPRVIADFGTGNGMLARALAAEAGADATIHALDFFDEPPAPMDNVRYMGFAEAARTLSGKVDLLTCFHVLEHDDDSDAMLQRLLAYLRPGGTLVVEVPNVDCVWNGWFGKACANWYAPFHRVHFTRRSLRALFERHDLTILREEDICGPTFALSLAALLGVAPNSLLFAVAAGLRPAQWIAEKVTRRPSALRIIARKS